MAPPNSKEADMLDEFIQDAWQELLDKTDRTSPSEYPDMVLISFEEFSAFIRDIVEDASNAKR